MVNVASEQSNILRLFADIEFNMMFCKVEFSRDYTLFYLGVEPSVYDYSRYIRNYFKIIRSAYSCINNCSLEQLSATLVHPRNRIINGTFMLGDIKSDGVNCINGVRKNPFVKGTYKNKLYIFGDSRTYGTYNEDGYTYCSCLQKWLNTNVSLSFEIVNCGYAGADYAYMYYLMAHTKIQSGDIVFFVHSFFFPDVEIQFLRDAKDYCAEHGVEFFFINLPLLEEVYQSDEEKILYRLFTKKPVIKGTDEISNALYRLRKECIPYYDLREALMRQNRIGRESFYVDQWHFGSNGNIWIADELFQFLKCVRTKDTTKEAEKIKNKTYGELLKFIRLESEKNNVEKYVEKIVKRYKNENSKDAGAVVMNCNPFTKGHLHLVEQALAQSDFLYIFVVEEDRSEFPFALRFRLVKEGVAHLKKVAVIPSGQFIISSMTFPGYFNRDDSKGDVADAWDDLMIFAVNIAPPMGIRKRFVGEEPFSAITNHYHRQMKEILPRNGVDVVEIPRLTFMEEKSKKKYIISASAVRRLVKQQRWDELRKYVPESTFTCLKEMESSINL